MDTRTDVGASEWQLDDEIVRLRIWGTSLSHPLPARTEQGTIGTDDLCWMTVKDPSGHTSRRHALLVYESGHWIVRDLASKNGTRADGARCDHVSLHAGVELGIGGLLLVAESPRSIAVSAYLARVLGWSDQQVTVDEAFRSIRRAAARRSTLVLSGHGNLVDIAHSLHCRVLGRERPFVLCHPERTQLTANARSVESRPLAREAIEAASGGTICLLKNSLPRDFNVLLDKIRHPNSKVQLIACLRRTPANRSFGATTIVVPPLSSRSNEVPLIIDECAADAMLDLKFSKPLATADHDWLRKHSNSFSDIEKGTRRLLAVRNTSSISRASAMLGISHVALGTWLLRRKL